MPPIVTSTIRSCNDRAEVVWIRVPGMTRRMQVSSSHAHADDLTHVAAGPCCDRRSRMAPTCAGAQGQRGGGTIPADRAHGKGRRDRAAGKRHPILRATCRRQRHPARTWARTSTESVALCRRHGVAGREGAGARDTDDTPHAERALAGCQRCGPETALTLAIAPCPAAAVTLTRDSRS